MVTVTVDAGTSITITPCNASGTAIAPPDVFPATAVQNITSVVAKPQNFDYTKWDRWGNPAPPATGMPDYIPAMEFYVVRIHLTGHIKYYDLKLTEVFGQVTWTNDVTGATAAIGALDAVFP